MRWTPDSVDLFCLDWAVQRRKALGIVSTITPSERLGKLRSTLGSVREEGQGASYTKESQNWPEVYVGDLLHVHRCQAGMPGPWREVMHLQYVWKELSVQVKADEIHITISKYFERLGNLKIAIASHLRANGVNINWSTR